MFPLVAKRFATGEKYMKIFLSSLLLTIAIAVAFLLIFVTIPRVLIQTLYSTQYLEATQYLLPFGILTSFFALSTLLVNFALSINKVKVALLPLITAVVQFAGIWLFHSNIETIIRVNFVISALLLLSLSVYLSYETGAFAFSNRTRI
jgi:O-antigen/teichoic acid export membrane protein